MLISCIGRISLLVEGANRLLVSALLHPKIGHPGLRLGFQGAPSRMSQGKLTIQPASPPPLAFFTQRPLLL